MSIFKLTLAFILVGAPLLGTIALNSSSEAREAYVASQMLVSDNWTLPLRAGWVPSKPPLYHWLTALGSATFSSTINQAVTPFTSRLPSLLAGALCLLLTGSIGSALSRAATKELRRREGVLAATILALSYGFVAMSCRAMVDMTYALFVTAAMWVVAQRFRTVQRSEGKPIDPIWFFAACGLAILSKGPLGLVLPLMLALVAFVALDGSGPSKDGGGMDAVSEAAVDSEAAAPVDAGNLVAISEDGRVMEAMRSDELGLLTEARRVLLSVRGWVTLLLLTLPWYLAAANLGGIAFIKRQLLFENLERFTGGGAASAGISDSAGVAVSTAVNTAVSTAVSTSSEVMNVEAWWFYLPSLLRTTFPWSVILVVLFFRKTLTSWAKPRRFKFNSLSLAALNVTQLRRAIGRHLPLCWITVSIAFFSLASGKRHSYLLPIYPYVAILVAQLLGELEPRIVAYLERHKTKERLMQATACLLMVLALFSIVLSVLSAATVPLNPGFSWCATQLPLYLTVIGFALIVENFSARRSGSAKDQGLTQFALLPLTLMITVSFGGFGFKSSLNDFNRIATEISQKLDWVSGVPIVLNRPEHDGFMDPLLFYLNLPKSYEGSLFNLAVYEKVRGDKTSHSAASTPPPCPATIILRESELGMLGAYYPEANYEIIHQARYTTWGKRNKVKSDETVVLLRCRSR